ncbi:MAG: Signal peptidase I [Ktedonobacterales bacterium]|jgi:signal peptidase I|nr:MAG: Signal peptidase I [Ktedonobacterales bacterium]
MAQQAAANRSADYAYEDEQGEQRGARLLREVLEVAILTLLLFIVVHLVIQNYRVEGPSMTPTLLNHQYILVDKAQYLFGKPQRGDIIVFEWPRDTSQDFVKRVIGLPGDTVTVDANGVVTVDGTQLNEPYINDMNNPYQPNTWVLGADQYFVLGDNRGDSSDSRDWGPVPMKDIIGKATLVYWPAPDIHFVHDWSNVFQGIGK